jgi:hypothetical protein
MVEDITASLEKYKSLLDKALQNVNQACKKYAISRIDIVAKISLNWD